jgi:hypothetical protein
MYMFSLCFENYVYLDFMCGNVSILFIVFILKKKMHSRYVVKFGVLQFGIRALVYALSGSVSREV